MMRRWGGRAAVEGGPMSTSSCVCSGGTVGAESATAVKKGESGTSNQFQKSLAVPLANCL
jgi:hypothetical protein